MDFEKKDPVGNGHLIQFFHVTDKGYGDNRSRIFFGGTDMECCRGGLQTHGSYNGRWLDVIIYFSVIQLRNDHDDAGDSGRISLENV